MPIVCIQSGIRGISKQQKSCYIFAEVVGIWQLRLKLLALAQGRVVGSGQPAGHRILLSVKGIQYYYYSLLHCSNDNNNACADVFFSFLFYFQDIPTYCLTLTMLVLCLDRHQSIRHPEKAPMPITWILGLVWFVSIALVLPYMAYIKHFDLSVSYYVVCYVFRLMTCLSNI